MRWTRWGIGRLNERERQPAIFYLHPWEIDPDQPRLQAGVLSRLRHYRNLDKTEARLRALLRDFRFGPLAPCSTARGSGAARPAASGLSCARRRRRAIAADRGRSVPWQPAHRPSSSARRSSQSAWDRFVAAHPDATWLSPLGVAARLRAGLRSPHRVPRGDARRRDRRRAAAGRSSSRLFGRFARVAAVRQLRRRARRRRARAARAARSRRRRWRARGRWRTSSCGTASRSSMACPSSSTRWRWRWRCRRRNRRHVEAPRSQGAQPGPQGARRAG